MFSLLHCSYSSVVQGLFYFPSCWNKQSEWVGGWVAGLLTILTTDRSIQTDTVLTVKKEGLYIKFQSCSHFIQENNTE